MHFSRKQSHGFFGLVKRFDETGAALKSVLPKLIKMNFKTEPNFSIKKPKKQSRPRMKI